MTALLAAERVHLRPPGAERDVVRDVSLAVAPGEIVALVGPNGSGKSTLLAALARSLRPRAGSVRLAGTDVWRQSARAFARQVARLPQDPVCAEGLRVEQLVAAGRHPHRSALAPLGPVDRAAVREAIAALELGDLRARTLETLSGGERRRAWIALALAQETPVLLLDEPTAALDVRHQWDVLARLARINQDRAVAIVVSLHDLEQAAALAHRVAVLHRGRLYAAGAPERVLDEQALCDVFGVAARVTKEDGRLRVQVLRPADPVRAL
jgi:iron complex transport system ATP-binding protein